VVDYIYYSMGRIRNQFFSVDAEVLDVWVGTTKNGCFYAHGGWIDYYNPIRTEQYPRRYLKMKTFVEDSVLTNTRQSS